MKRIRLVGAESTGKTTLAVMLASHFGTVFVPEFGRAYGAPKDMRGEKWRSGEFDYIALCQNATEDIAAGLAKEYLFCDTDALTTAIYHEEYLGVPSESILQLVRTYDLTFLLSKKAPFVPDGARREARRERFEERLLDELGDGNYIYLTGSIEKRFHQAWEAIRAL